MTATPPTKCQPECAQVAREIVTDWLGAFDPAPQIDFVQSEMLQAAIVSALRAAPARCDAPISPPSEAGREEIKQILVEMIQRHSSKLIVVDYETTIDRILALSPDQGTVAVASAGSAEAADILQALFPLHRMVLEQHANVHDDVNIGWTIDLGTLRRASKFIATALPSAEGNTP